MWISRLISTGISPAAAGATDPYFSNVQLLLAYDGTDGSTTITDDSQNGYSSPTRVGTLISTAQAKAGTASGKYSVGNTYDAYCTWPNSTTPTNNFNLALDSAFTIEAFIYVTGTSTAGHIFEWGTGAGARNVVYLNGAYPEVYSDPGAGQGGNRVNNGTRAVTTNTWQHICLMKTSATDYRLFLDGVQCGSVWDGTRVYNPSATAMKFDQGMNVYGLTAGDRFLGYCDETRVTKAVARYSTGGFTVPTAPFPRS